MPWKIKPVIEMITFACKKIKQEELIRCSFSLNKTEYNVLMFLLKRDSPLTASQIAEIMGLERTTVQKAVKNLFSKKLAGRMQKNLPKGGYTFFYEIRNKKEIKDRMKSIVYDWYKSAEKAINKI